MGFGNIVVCAEPRSQPGHGGIRNLKKTRGLLLVPSQHIDKNGLTKGCWFHTAAPALPFPTCSNHRRPPSGQHAPGPGPLKGWLPLCGLLFRQTFYEDSTIRFWKLPLFCWREPCKIKGLIFRARATEVQMIRLHHLLRRAKGFHSWHRPSCP